MEDDSFSVLQRTDSPVFNAFKKSSDNVLDGSFGNLEFGKNEEQKNEVFERGILEEFSEQELEIYDRYIEDSDQDIFMDQKTLEMCKRMKQIVEKNHKNE